MLFPSRRLFQLSSERVINGCSKRPVQWFFNNLLPKEAMREALAKEATNSASDASGLLAYYDRETTIALSLMAEGEKALKGNRASLPLNELERRIRAMPVHALSATSLKRMSAARAQQKLLGSLTGQHPKHELFEPVSAEPSMHLLKPDMRTAGYSHSAINELFCARLSRASWASLACVSRASGARNAYRRSGVGTLDYRLGRMSLWISARGHCTYQSK